MLVARPNFKDKSAGLTAVAKSVEPPKFSLDDLLGHILDALPEEVETCSSLLGALRLSGRCTRIPLDKEVEDLREALARTDSRRERSSNGSSLASPFLTLHMMLTEESERLTTRPDGVKSQQIGILKENRAAGLSQQLTKMYTSTELLEVQDAWASENDDSALADRSETPSKPSRTPWFPRKQYGNMRQRLFLMLEDPTLSVMGRIATGLVIITVIVSTVSFVLESVPELRVRPAECQRLRSAGQPLTVDACEPEPHGVFFLFEVVCITIFTIEYVARMSLVHSVADGNGLLFTLRYAMLGINVIDFLAIVPFYISIIGVGAKGSLRILRLLRVLRLFKLSKHHPGVAMLAEVMAMSGQPLLLLLFFNIIVVVLFGSLMYFAENEKFSVAPEFTEATIGCNSTEPALFPLGVIVRTGRDMVTEEVSPFRSIPVGLWWVVVTMTTVGYGDISPTTTQGKTIGALTFYVGIIFLALPIGVLSTNFELVYRKQNPQKPLEAEDFELDREALKKRKERMDSVHFGGGVVNGWWPSLSHYGLRRAMFLACEVPLSSPLSQAISFLMTATILGSTLAFILESMPRFQHIPSDCKPGSLTAESCTPEPDGAFFYVEAVCISIFTVDYIIRMSCVHAADPDDCGFPAYDQTGQRLQANKLLMSLRYAVQPLNIIDFLAILPFWIGLAVEGFGGIPVLRVLRLVRVFRLLKAPKLRVCAEMFIKVLIDAAPALFTLAFLTSLTCIFLAACVHYAEGGEYSVDPEWLDDFPEGVYIRPSVDGYSMEPTPYRSILYSCWWFFVTATTVGYGDDFPTTTLGRIVGICTFTFGIVLLALPLSIIGGSFNKFYPDWVAEFSPVGTEDHAVTTEKAQEILDSVADNRLRKEARLSRCSSVHGINNSMQNGHNTSSKSTPVTDLKESPRDDDTAVPDVSTPPPLKAWE